MPPRLSRLHLPLLTVAAIAPLILFRIWYPSEAIAQEITYGNREFLTFLFRHATAEDRLYTGSETGSMLIFYGLTPVFCDTHFDSYPKEFCLRENRCLSGTASWDELFKDYRITRIIAQDDDLLTKRKLKSDPDWYPVADDGRFTMWIRGNREGEDLLSHWHLTDDQLVSGAPLSDRIVRFTLFSRYLKYQAQAEYLRQHLDQGKAAVVAGKASSLAARSNQLKMELILHRIEVPNAQVVVPGG